jgi:phosphatidylethanolamine-binding protein (PEBP) family uncharacterized protein
MKYALGSLFLAGGLALSISTAKADPLTLTSPQIQDNGTLAVKNACSDKQRSPNCVGENVSPPLAWSGVPEGTKSFAPCCSIPKVVPRPACRTWWFTASPQT